MDFGKMTDQFKEQASEKVKEELLQKVDEVKAEVEKKFASIGGTKDSGPVQGESDAKADGSPLGGSQPEGQSTTEQSVDQTADDSTSATADVETDQQSDDDTSDKVA